MKIPKYIEFHNNTNSILSRFFKAAEPEEGCAILIGQRKNLSKDALKNFWEIKRVWKCCNIWGKKESRLVEQNQTKFNRRKEIKFTRKNRFEIDTKDQIAAQKWARKNNLEILCCAHSHPSGPNTPSETDLNLHNSPGLMVISNKNGNLKAWWIKNKYDFHKVEIGVFL